MLWFMSLKTDDAASSESTTSSLVSVVVIGLFPVVESETILQIQISNTKGSNSVC